MALIAAEVRERYERLREQVGDGVTVVAATKYVSLDELGLLAEAGLEVVGENRAQDLAAKHAAYGDAFRWHFIGHLQSNKVKLVNDICELVHSLDSDSSARRLTVPALLEVNLTGEGTKSGVAPDELRVPAEVLLEERDVVRARLLSDDRKAARRVVERGVRREAVRVVREHAEREAGGLRAGGGSEDRGRREPRQRMTKSLPTAHAIPFAT